jgi:hypothetical protein
MKYRVNRGDANDEIWIDNRLVKVGTTVEMTEEAAKYLLLDETLVAHPLDHDQDGRLGGSRPRRTTTRLRPPAEEPVIHDVSGA